LAIAVKIIPIHYSFLFVFDAVKVRALPKEKVMKNP
jgi:hypothetical protein